MKKLFLLLNFTLIVSFLSFSQLPNKKLIKIMNNANAAPNSTSDVIIDCTPITLNGCNYITNSNFTPNFNYDIFNIWDHYIDPFTLGLIPNWYPAQNTPQLTDGNLDNTTGPPYTWIDPPSAAPSPATYYEHGTSTHFGNGLTIVEGVAQKIPALTPGKKYLFSYFDKIKDYIGGSWLDTYNVYLMHCSDNNVFTNPSIPIPVHSQQIVCQTNLTHQAWQRYLTTFTATEDFDMIWIFPKQNTVQPPYDFAFVGAEIAYPELIDVNNFSAGNPPNPTPGNCTVTIGPTVPNCGVANAVFTWTGQLQTITAPTNQQIQVDASDPLNVGIWTLIMTVPNALTPNGTCSQTANVSATVDVTLCCNHPTITADGPLDHCAFYEWGFLTFSTNLSSNIQWYNNGNIIPGATAQTYFEGNNPGPGWPTSTGTYYVKNTATGCRSNILTAIRRNYTTPYTNYQSLSAYCKNTVGTIGQQPSLSDPNTIYRWKIFDPFGNDVTGTSVLLGANNSNIYSTTISFANYPYTTATIILNTTDNGCTNDFWAPYTVTINQNCFMSNIITQKNVFNNKIYPNPSSNQVEIISSDQITLIEISDLMNPTLKRIKVNNTKSVTINVADLRPGIYNCKITTSKGIEYQKLLINR